jgi:NADH-quinone oxidoreductase subunit I
MSSNFKYFTDLFSGIRSLLKGMSVTGRYFFSPGAIVTEQYPENRKTLKMQDRFKGEIIMPHNEQNEHKCTGCGICELNCPNGSIEVITKMVEDVNGKKKKVLDLHVYNLSMCTFCGLCVKVCPSSALDFGQEFEHAVYNRDKLIKTLNKPGSSLSKKVEA